MEYCKTDNYYEPEYAGGENLRNRRRVALAQACAEPTSPHWPRERSSMTTGSVAAKFRFLVADQTIITVDFCIQLYKFLAW